MLPQVKKLLCKKRPSKKEFQHLRALGRAVKRLGNTVGIAARELPPLLVIHGEDVAHGPLDRLGSRRELSPQTVLVCYVVVQEKEGQSGNFAECAHGLLAFLVEQFY